MRFDDTPLLQRQVSLHRIIWPALQRIDQEGEPPGHPLRDVRWLRRCTKRCVICKITIGLNPSRWDLNFMRASPHWEYLIVNGTVFYAIPTWLDLNAITRSDRPRLFVKVQSRYRSSKRHTRRQKDDPAWQLLNWRLKKTLHYGLKASLRYVLQHYCESF